MTKKEMIEKIAYSELEAWKRLKEDEFVFGKDSDFSHYSRTAWSAIHVLSIELGIDDFCTKLHIQEGV